VIFANYCCFILLLYLDKNASPFLFFCELGLLHPALQSVLRLGLVARPHMEKAAGGGLSGFTGAPLLGPQCEPTEPDHFTSGWSVYARRRFCVAARWEGRHQIRLSGPSAATPHYGAPLAFSAILPLCNNKLVLTI
jgi:hypothetical protein